MTITPSATLPLTTIFSAPTSCFSTIYKVGQEIQLGLGPECVPFGAQTSERTYAFSPGLECPYSYTTARVTQVTLGTITESRAICCPVLYGIDPLSDLIFNYNPASNGSPWYFTLGCSAAFTQNVVITALENGTSVTETWGTNNGLNAYSVQIAWRSKDLPTAPTATTSSNLPSESAILQFGNLSFPSATSTPSSISNDELLADARLKASVAIILATISLVLVTVLISILLAKRCLQKRLLDNRSRCVSQQDRLQNEPGVFVENRYSTRDMQTIT